MRILVADDCERVRHQMRELLESRQGWTVCHESADGRDAVEKAIALAPDVVLLDVRMPRLNGWEAARFIHENLPACAILIVTDYPSNLMAAAASQAGVRGYIVKSDAARDLIAAIEAIVARDAASSAQERQPIEA